MNERDNILTRAAQVIAGPTNTVVIDRQRTYWLAGKVSEDLGYYTLADLVDVVEEHRRWWCRTGLHDLQVSARAHGVQDVSCVPRRSDIDRCGRGRERLEGAATGDYEYCLGTKCREWRIRPWR